jgi:hypothetical protein
LIGKNPSNQHSLHCQFFCLSYYCLKFNSRLSDSLNSIEI